MEVARAVQRQLEPPPIPEFVGVEMAARFLPSSAVSGDFCDYFRLESRYLGIYLGDAQSKGLEGAMYALMVSGIMRGIAKTGHEPTDVVAFLNQRLRFRPLPGKFCCLTYALVDLEQRHVVLTNAGLPFPLLRRGQQLTRVEAGGIPPGLFDVGSYDQAVVSLQPGDCILFYTDGLPDSLEALRPRAGDGEKQLRGLLTRHAEKSAPRLADQLVTHLRSAQKARRQKELSDDATFLVLRVP